MKDSECLYQNIFLSERVQSPAVYGIIRPRIILPAYYAGIELKYVLQHERTHIRRCDNLWRLIRLKTRESTAETIDYQETFQYLLHFTGMAPATARYSSYDNYVLVDDPSATWEGIMEGIISSKFGAGYKHCTVYQNIFD
jgi:hypothetical protein